MLMPPILRLASAAHQAVHPDAAARSSLGHHRVAAEAHPYVTESREVRAARQMLLARLVVLLLALVLVLA
jgi:uncharacterized membrane protein affecting hemolysin expression